MNPIAQLRRHLCACACLPGALLLLATVTAAAAAQTATPPAARNRPNIVFVLVDDAGFSDFGSYGSEIETPNLDEIAKAGVRFTNFHTASTCEESRAMLQTGVDSHLAGFGTLQVVVADNQRGKPGYEGYLSDQAYSLGQLLHDGGYATYFAGKWDLGDGLEHSPGAKGWDRYMSLQNTGADNYEDKVYAPFTMEAVWWEDGHRATLPADFYSSRYYVDKLIQYIDEGKKNSRPFFAMLSFQAVHSPLQAPNPDIDKYLQRYRVGWDVIRAERYQREVQMGLVPGGMQLPQAPFTKPWNSLSERERRDYTKKMAVYAGMLDSADQNVGRLRKYLKQAGMLDNTVFILMSDNGADAYDLSELNLPFKIWYRVHKKLDYEDMGLRGSYVHYGQDWAQVSNTPFAGFKGTSAEGGMRVPFAVSYPGRIKSGGISKQFSYATDFLPTVLDIAGIPLTGDEYKGRKMHRPSGTSLLPYLEGKTPVIHASTEATGFEGTGGKVLFKGDYKLLLNPPPFSDNRWRLVDLNTDPAEAHDLSGSLPDVVQTMRAEYATYVARDGVIQVPPDYDGLRQLLKNNWPILVRQLGGILATALAVLLALLAAAVYAVRHWLRRSRSQRQIA